jgi:hypothetical protein
METRNSKSKGWFYSFSELLGNMISPKKKLAEKDQSILEGLETYTKAELPQARRTTRYGNIPAVSSPVAVRSPAIFQPVKAKHLRYGSSSSSDRSTASPRSSTTANSPIADSLVEGDTTHLERSASKSSLGSRDAASPVEFVSHTSLLSNNAADASQAAPASTAATPMFEPQELSEEEHDKRFEEVADKLLGCYRRTKKEYATPFAQQHAAKAKQGPLDHIPHF